MFFVSTFPQLSFAITSKTSARNADLFEKIICNVYIAILAEILTKIKMLCNLILAIPKGVATCREFDRI